MTISWDQRIQAHHMDTREVQRLRIVRLTLRMKGYGGGGPRSACSAPETPRTASYAAGHDAGLLLEPLENLVEGRILATWRCLVSRRHVASPSVIPLRAIPMRRLPHIPHGDLPHAVL